MRRQQSKSGKCSSLLIAASSAALLVSACGHNVATNATSGSPGNGGVIPLIRQGHSDFYPTWIRLPTTGTGYGSGITLGADGTVWVANGNNLTRINYWRQMQTFALGNTGAGDIATGPDGNIWYADFSAHAVGRLNPTTGKVDLFPTPSGGQPLYLIRGPDGNMWFTEPQSAGKFIGRITMAGVITEFAATIASPAELAAGPDGDIYFGEYGGGSGDIVGRITPAGKITERSISGIGSTFTFATGPDGNVYFIDDAGFAAIMSGFQVVQYAFPSSGGLPGPVAGGPDGNVWVAGTSNDNKHVILSIFDVHSKQWLSFSPTSPSKQYKAVGEMITGRDGNLWWTDLNQTDVYVYHAITASPDPLLFSAPGQQQTLTASETNFSGTLTAVSSNPGIVTVKNGNAPNTFTATSVAPGDTFITIYDGHFNSLGVHVVVQ